MTPSVSDGRDAWRGQRARETGCAGCATVARNADRGARLGSPGDAPRKRYLYTSLRFFLGINMATECCLSTTTARLEGVNRPCGGGAGEAGQAAFGSCRETRWKEPSRRAGPGSRRVARDANPSNDDDDGRGRGKALGCDPAPSVESGRSGARRRARAKETIDTNARLTIFSPLTRRRLTSMSKNFGKRSNPT